MQHQNKPDKKKQRPIIVALGSENDLDQCREGLEILDAYVAEQAKQNQTEEHETDMATIRDHVSQDQPIGNQTDIFVYVKSAHRHTMPLLDLLAMLVKKGLPFIIIAGAGKANVLPGFIDSVLRYTHGNTTINVIGVAFKGKTELDDIAATTGITQVPGTQVTFASEGFTRACIMATQNQQDLPVITPVSPPPSRTLTLEQALNLAIKKNQQPQTINTKP